MAGPHQPMQVDRAMQRLDTLLPQHAHHGGPRERSWTTRTGQYRVTVPEAHDGPAQGAVFFEAMGTRWHVTVPRTGAGLDALTVCMVLAGAIDAPRAGTAEVRQAGASSMVSVTDGADNWTLGGAQAFGLGVQLVEQSGRTGRY